MTDALYERLQYTLKTLELTVMPLHLDQLTKQAAAANWSAHQSAAVRPRTDARNASALSKPRSASLCCPGPAGLLPRRRLALRFWNRPELF
jgi:hypothetical protein